MAHSGKLNFTEHMAITTGPSSPGNTGAAGVSAPSATPAHQAPRHYAADLLVPPACRALIERGALVAVNHSGGKDSQWMTILLSRIVLREQFLDLHAPLGEVEWPGTIEHIERTIPPDLRLVLAPVASGKTPLDRGEERRMFASSSARWCTSDAKRMPIERELRRYLKTHPRFGGLLISAMGMRAAESPARSKLIPWKRNSRNSKAGREWFDWLPIHALETPDVFRIIHDAGQLPHWAYAAGMSRLSCSFCILASRANLRRAAELRPDLYARYAALEQRIGHTLSPSRKPLPGLTGLPVDPARASLSPTRGIRDRNATGRQVTSLTG